MEGVRRSREGEVRAGCNGWIRDPRASTNASSGLTHATLSHHQYVVGPGSRLGVPSPFAEPETVVERQVSGTERLEEAWRSTVISFGKRRCEKSLPEAASLLRRIDGDNGQVPGLWRDYSFGTQTHVFKNPMVVPQSSWPEYTRERHEFLSGLLGVRWRSLREMPYGNAQRRILEMYTAANPSACLDRQREVIRESSSSTSHIMAEVDGYGLIERIRLQGEGSAETSGMGASRG